MFGRLLGFAAATVIPLIPHVALAQRGQQIFDLFLQGAQQEQQQRQQLNRLHQEFTAHWHACHRGEFASCDLALGYHLVNSHDRQALLRKRAQILTAEQEAAERTRRERLQSELEERRRQSEREEAERQRQRAEQAERERLAEARLLALHQEQYWQNVYVGFGIFGAILLIGAITAAIAGFLRRTASPTANATVSETPSAMAAGSAAADAQSEPPLASQPALGPEPPRDTAGAVAALELALAYLEEVREADTPDHDDKDARKHHLNTLALAAKQLDLAGKLDANAVLEGEHDSLPYRYSINELKAEALLLEGITHQRYDLRRAIPALAAAARLNPNNARAFYVLGLVQASNMNKGQAVASFERAVALDPKNIAYRKELNRTQSLSAAEVAGYKVTRAGERVFDGAVMTWNLFAVLWNVLTFPLRVVVGIFRLLRLHPFA